MRKMNGKSFSGKTYTFTLINPQRPVGRGGNGSVYNARILSPQTEGEYVVKFFDCQEKDPQKLRIRYERFQREVEHVVKFTEIVGIIPVLDYSCPDEWSGSFSAWYLMPKAERYHCTERHSTAEILRDFLNIALTLKELHQQGYAHRDIKPGNLMLYKERLCLIDYGLLWREDLERLTIYKEKVGPHKILPPELESIDKREYIDYRASDVYLFTKTLWIYLTGNRDGFAGPYRRNNDRVYLQRDQMQVQTCEPLHQLLEQATLDDYAKRINIDICIDLLKLQLGILEHADTDEPEWKAIIDQNIYAENTKRIISLNKPQTMEYADINTIAEILDGIIEHSIISIEDHEATKPYIISLIGFNRLDDREIVFYEERNRESYHYHASISCMRFETRSEEIEVLLTDIPDTHLTAEEKRFNKTVLYPEKENRYMYLSSSNIICFKKNK